jgi:urea-proton symporter
MKTQKLNRFKLRGYAMEISLMKGVGLILAYMLAVYIVAKIYAGRKRLTKSGFLVADREVTMLKGAFSIASSWIWAPALFVSAQKAYEQGIVGLFWFTVPNVLCLIVFAYFAVIIRNKVPLGYTLSGYMKELYGHRVHNAYLFQSLSLLTCSIAVQLLAGGKVVSLVTGVPYFWVTVILAIVALSYSVAYGLRASIITDLMKLNIIFIIGLILIPWAIYNGGGFSHVVDGIGGFSGEFKNLFDSKGLQVFLTFGLPATIGLMSGPFGDQSFWQRAFAIREGQVKKAFMVGALVFAAVPIAMSLLGFLGAGLKIVPKEAQLINLEVILRMLPTWTLILFAYMIMSGLVSALDSHMTAISSVGGHDLLNRVAHPSGNSISERRIIKWARATPIVVTLLAIGIANIPGMQIIYMFLFYGTLRASTLLPTIITLLRKTPANEASVFWGIIISIFIGLPIFVYGNFTNITFLIITGSLVTVSASGIITLLGKAKS